MLTSVTGLLARGAGALALAAVLVSCADTQSTVDDLVGKLPADRTAWVVSELSAWNAGLTAASRQEKYGMMEADLFSFYRGTDHLFWKDKGTSPALSTYGNVARTRIWLQGDMHADNMGSFANDQGEVVYDLNDFDEAVLGDYQLDLWRLAVSLVLVMRDNGGFSAANQSAVVDAATESYLDTVERWNGNDGEGAQVYTAANTYGKLDDFLAGVASASTQKLLDKYTSKSPSGRTFDPSKSSDIEAVPASTASAITAQMAAYGSTLSGGLAYASSYFTVKSVARRLHAGVGSLGTIRYYVLIEGPSSSQDDDIILDVKAQSAPSAYQNLSAAARSAIDAASGKSHARRVVQAAKALGNHVDDHLGYLTLFGQGYSVRQRSPWKDTLDTTALDSVDRMTKMAEQWGAILATAHCRADKDANAAHVPYDFDHEVTSRIDGKHDKFRAALRAVVLPYADQVESDYHSFMKARSKGAL
jgi:uncharacterized protein (DUF2252 family)